MAKKASPKKSAIKKVSKKTAKSTRAGASSKKVVKKSAKKAAAKTVKKAIGKTAKKTAAKTVKKVAKKVAKKTVAKKVAKKVAKTVAAKKVAKKTVQKTAKKTAAKTVKKSAAKKSAVKVVPQIDAEVTDALESEGPKPLKKTPLSRKELNAFKKMLIMKRRSILGDMNHIESGVFRGVSGDLSSVPTHPADMGTDNYEQEFSLGLLESERALLGEIEDALERIEDRTYGICEGTGQAIGVARLTARPWSKYSIEYARKLEHNPRR